MSHKRISHKRMSRKRMSRKRMSHKRMSHKRMSRKRRSRSRTYNSIFTKPMQLRQESIVLRNSQSGNIVSGLRAYLK
jgi:hypothetical protein